VHCGVLRNGKAYIKAYSTFLQSYVHYLQSVRVGLTDQDTKGKGPIVAMKILQASGNVAKQKEKWEKPEPVWVK
jgi:hypothetical protein